MTRMALKVFLPFCRPDHLIINLSNQICLVQLKPTKYHLSYIQYQWLFGKVDHVIQLVALLLINSQDLVPWLSNYVHWGSNISFN